MTDMVIFAMGTFVSVIFGAAVYTVGRIEFSRMIHSEDQRMNQPELAPIRRKRTETRNVWHEQQFPQ